METITYVSTAAHLLSLSELETLLEECRRFNSTHGVTGMLLYDSGSFIQTIEGDPSVIRKLYDKICKDKRHYGVIKIIHEEISDRSFEKWSMGFKNDTSDQEGFTDIFRYDSDAESYLDEDHHGQRLLLNFRNQNARFG